MWSLERIQKICLSKTFLSVRSGSLNGHLRTIFFRNGYTTMPHASSRSPRRGDRHGPDHTSSGALCVELSELTSSIPIRVTGRGQRKIVCQLRFHVKFWDCAASDQRHDSGKGFPPFHPPPRFFPSLPPSLPLLPSLFPSLPCPPFHPSLSPSPPLSSFPAGSHPILAFLPSVVPGT